MNAFEVLPAFATDLANGNYGRPRAPGTVRAYLADVRQFLTRDQVQDISRVTLAEIDDFLAQVGGVKYAGRNTARVNRIIASLRAFFGWAAEQGLIERNPLAHKHVARPGLRTPVYLESNEVQAFLKAVGDYHALRSRSHPPKTPQQQKRAEHDLQCDRCLYVFALNTGARISEMLSLRLDDVDLNHRTAKVIGKRDRERVLHLNETTVAALRTYLHLRPPTSEAFLFVSFNGVQLGVRNLQKKTRRIAALAGITKPITPHKLRHTQGTALLRVTGNLRVVQEALGHQNVATTEIYTHITAEEVRSAVERLNFGDD